MCVVCLDLMGVPPPPKKTIDKSEIFEDCLAAYRKVKFKTWKCLLCFSVHDGAFRCFWLFHMLLFCWTANWVRKPSCSCVTSGVSFSSAPDRSEQNEYWVLLRRNSSRLLYSNSLQSQQSFCSFLGLRAVWVVSWCRFGLIEQGWHDVCRSTFLFSQKWVKAIAGSFAVGLDSSSRAELAELLRVRDGGQLKCWCQQREGFFISLVSPQAELYSSCSAEQLKKFTLIVIFDECISFCVQCYYGCDVHLMADFTSPNDSSGRTSPFSRMYKIKWTHPQKVIYNYCKDIIIWIWMQVIRLVFAVLF